MNIKVTGLKELKKAIDKAGRDIQKQTDSEIKRIADEILQAALARVPVDKGELKGSGFIEKIEGGYAVGFSIKYAPYIEFGSGPLTEIPVGFEDYAITFYIDGSGHTPAQPFLFPAYLARKDKIIDELTAKLDEYVKSF